MWRPSGGAASLYRSALPRSPRAPRRRRRGGVPAPARRGRRPGRAGHRPLRRRLGARRRRRGRGAHRQPEGRRGGAEGQPRGAWTARGARTCASAAARARRACRSRGRCRASGPFSLRRAADRGRRARRRLARALARARLHPELGRDTRLGTSVDRRGAARSSTAAAGRCDRALRRRRRRRGRQGAAPPPSGSPRSSTSTPTTCNSASRPRRGPLPARDHAARGRLRQGRGRADRGPGRVAEPHEGLARPVSDVRADAARDRRAGHLRAGRGVGWAAWPRRHRRPVGARALLRGAARGHADAAGADPLSRDGRGGEDARPQGRQARRVAAHAARPRRADRGRAGAGGASRRARWRWSSLPPATCWRSPTGPRTTSTARCRAAIRPGRPSRSSARRRCCATGWIRRPCRLPADDRGRGQVVSQLRGRRGRRGAVQHRLRAELQHRLRLAGRPPAARRPADVALRFGLGEKLERACRWPMPTSPPPATTSARRR